MKYGSFAENGQRIVPSWRSGQHFAARVRDGWDGSAVLGSACGAQLGEVDLLVEDWRAVTCDECRMSMSFRLARRRDDPDPYRRRRASAIAAPSDRRAG